MALLEIAIIIPLIFIIVFIPVELTNQIVLKMKLKSASDTAVKYWYRGCRGSASLDSCADTALDAVSTQIDAVLPDFESNGALILSVYRPDFDHCDPNTAVLASKRSKGLSSYSSAYSASSFDTELFTHKVDTVFVLEMFYKNETGSPLAGFFSAIRPGSLSARSVFTHKSPLTYVNC